MRKIIKALLSAVMIITAAVGTVYADAEDIAEKELLSRLGIVSEDELGRDGITTRAEFVTYALRLTRQTAAPDNSMPQFTDVAKSYWAYNEISTAYSLGMIKPKIGGRFEPDSPIEAADASRILLCAIGYGDYLKNMSDTAILRLADSIKLFDGAVKAVGAPLDRDTVMKLLFNAVSVDMPFLGGVKADGTPLYQLKKGVNILSEHFDVHYTEGIVTADSNTAISGERAGAGDVIIGGVTYNTDGIDTDKWIGMNVGCWWRDNSVSREVVVIFDEDNTVCEFSFRNARFSSAAFIEATDSKNITRRINSKSTLLVNSSVISKSSHINDSLENYAGNVKMIDNNGDGVYDVVMLNRYINIRISAYDDIENILYGYAGEEFLLNQYDDVAVYDCFLEKTELSKLSVDDIVSVYVPLAKEQRIKIIAGMQPFSSELISYDCSEKRNAHIICDDDIAYSLSEFCLIEWEDMIIGEDYAFYADWRGDIVFADMKVKDLKIGYLRRAYTVEGSDIVQLNIFSQNGVFLTVDLKERVSVRLADGTTKAFTAEEVINDILPLSCDVHESDNDTTHLNVKQPIMYKQNREDKISKIWILTTKQELIFHKLDDDKTKGKVNEDGKIPNYYFEYRNNNFEGKYICNSDTVMFVVPRKGNADSEYEIGTTGYFANGSTVHFHNKRQRIYMIAVEPDSFLTDIMIYKIDHTQSKGVKAATTPVIYYKMIETVNGDDEKVFKIFAAADDGTEKSYLVENCDELRDCNNRKLKYGDIIRVDTDEKGKITPSTIEIMYTASDDVTGSETFYKYQGDTSVARHLTSVRVIPAEIVARSGNYIKYSSVWGIDPDNEKGTSDEIASVAASKVYLFDKKQKTLTRTTPDRITDGDRVVMNLSYGVPKLIVYYK